MKIKNIIPFLAILSIFFSCNNPKKKTENLARTNSSNKGLLSVKTSDNMSENNTTNSNFSAIDSSKSGQNQFQNKENIATDESGNPTTTIKPLYQFDDFPINIRTESSADFAGHYLITRNECGFDCAYFIIIDVKTKKDLAFANEKDDFSSLSKCRKEDDGLDVDNWIETTADSRLLIAYGKQADGNTEDGSCMARYYEEKNNKLYLLKKVKMLTK